MKSQYDVLNLGAGVGSTTVYLLAHHGDLPPLDAAVFADTGEEPAPVYAHLQWLLTLNRPRILQGTIGKLGDHLLAGTNGAGQRRRSVPRFASVPAFTAPHHEGREVLTGCAVGRVKRQCTKEYKIEFVERCVRRELLGLKARQRVPKGVLVSQHFGLSDDEAHRIRRVKERLKASKWQVPVFPLARLSMTRADCVAYLERHVPHEVPRSACVFCPYRDARGWLWLKQNDPAGWQRAVAIDHAIRDPTARCAVGMTQSLYLHRKCVPLDVVNLEAEAAEEERRKGDGQRDLFSLLDADCSAGVCGV